MGADLPEDQKGIDEILNMSEDARKYLGHHLNNSLFVLITSLETGDIDCAKEAAGHMVEDLNRVGIRSGGRLSVQAGKRLNRSNVQGGGL